MFKLKTTVLGKSIEQKNEKKLSHQADICIKIGKNDKSLTWHYGSTLSLFLNSFKSNRSSSKKGVFSETQKSLKKTNAHDNRIQFKQIKLIEFKEVRLFRNTEKSEKN